MICGGCELFDPYRRFCMLNHRIVEFGERSCDEIDDMKKCDIEATRAKYYNMLEKSEKCAKCSGDGS